MATIKDVARQAGVSVSTVSRVMNSSAVVDVAKAKAVKEAMAALGYRPNALARALVGQRSDCIGLMVGELGAPFYSHMMIGIDRVVMNSGRHIIITCGYHSEAQEREGVEFLLERRVDALILHAKALSDEYLVSVFNKGIPVILLNRLVPGYEDRCIWLDNELGSAMATRHLHSRGHRQIGCISSSISGEDGEAREAGFNSVMTDAGLTCGEAVTTRALPDENGGHEAMSALIRQFPEITAVVTYNDAMAAGAISFLQDSGRHVPNDISIVGFDDVILAKLLQPRLTTIRYPIEEMGALAARLLVAELKGESRPLATSSCFTPRLIERQSVQPL